MHTSSILTGPAGPTAPMDVQVRPVWTWTSIHPPPPTSSPLPPLAPSRRWQPLIRPRQAVFSPSVFMAPPAATHPILGSSESRFGGGSAPMVVSRTGRRAEEDGSGLWQRSFPPPAPGPPSAALPVDSPTDAHERLFSTRVCPPSPSYLTTWPLAVHYVILWRSRHQRKRCCCCSVPLLWWQACQNHGDWNGDLQEKEKKKNTLLLVKHSESMIL